MRLTVRFFAAARDLAGRDDLELKMPEGSSITLLCDELVRTYPGLGKWRPFLRFAVNLEYAVLEKTLRDNDEVAVLPPVSGG